MTKSKNDRYKIPKTFQLGAQELHVVRPDSHPDNNTLGQYTPMSNEIMVCQKSQGILLHPTQQFQTYYHELVHAILFTMNHDLWDNELFVDNFGQFLAQHEITKRY